MSSDNCIAIACSKVYPEATEYQEFRVTRCNAIQNVNYNLQYFHQYFNAAAVFDDYQTALQYAQYLENCDLTEHGVLIIRQIDDLTWDEIDRGHRFFTKVNKLYNKRSKQ